jgi:hypothetical protein
MDCARSGSKVGDEFIQDIHPMLEGVAGNRKQPIVEPLVELGYVTVWRCASSLCDRRTPIHPEHPRKNQEIAS